VKAEEFVKEIKKIYKEISNTRKIAEGNKKNMQIEIFFSFYLFSLI